MASREWAGTLHAAVLLLACTALPRAVADVPASPASTAWRARVAAGPLAQRIDSVLRLTTQEFVPAQTLVQLGDELAPRADAAAERAIVAILRCRGYSRLERLDEARTHCAAAQEASRTSGSERLVAEALRLGAYLHVTGSSPEHALPLLNESLARARAAQDAFGAAAALNGLGVAAFVGGALAQAEQYYFDSLESFGPDPDVGLRAVVYSNLGYMYEDTGRHAQAQQYLARSLEDARRAGNATLARAARAGLAEARAALGRSREALADVAALVAELDDEPDAYARADVYVAGARIALRSGRPAEALEHARHAAAISNEHAFRRTFVGLLVVDALLALERHGDAAVEAAALRAGSGPFAVLAAELADRQSRAARALGRTAEATRFEHEADALRASLARGRAGEQASFVSARLAAELQASELARSRALQAAAEAAVGRARMLRNAAILAATVLLLAGALGWWIVARRREAAGRVALEREVDRRSRELEEAHERRRELEIEMDRRRRLESIGRLTGGVAHDYNNLMTIVRQCCDLLLLRPGVAADAEAVALVTESSRAATAAGEISQSLLAFARQRPQAAAPFLLGEHLAEVRPLLERAAGAERTLELAVHAAPLRVNVDRAQLTSVLINLVVNARDATPAGGLIAVAAERREVRIEEATHAGLAAGAYVAIAVRDDGVGMEPEIAERAIEPFFTTKGSSAGTGLGLSIAHGFATQAGGELRIASAPGVGTTVTLFLPEVRDGG